METSETTEGLEASAPLNITVTSTAKEVLTWRMLARQAAPMLTRPEQFPLAHRTQLAQTLCRLLDGSLELEDVFGEDTDDEYEPGCDNETVADPSCDGECGKEPW